MIEGNFEGVGGIKIFTREWQPAGVPRGVVVISHGLNAHSGLYAWAAQQFTSNGLAVYALDHRGRGRSEGERFFVKKFADWTQDLATFIDIAKEREPGLPPFAPALYFGTTTGQLWMGREGGEKWECLFDMLPPIHDVKVAVV